MKIGDKVWVVYCDCGKWVISDPFEIISYHELAKEYGLRSFGPGRIEYIDRIDVYDQYKYALEECEKRNKVSS